MYNNLLANYSDRLTRQLIFRLAEPIVQLPKKKLLDS